MEKVVINGIAYDFEDRDGKRYIRKPAGGAGGGVTGSVLECIGDTPATPETTTITVPVADAQAIEAAVEKAEADSHNET